MYNIAIQTFMDHTPLTAVHLWLSPHGAQRALAASLLWRFVPLTPTWLLPTPVSPAATTSLLSISVSLFVIFTSFMF